MLSHGDDAGTAPIKQLNSILLCEERLVSLWERLVTTLGIHTVRVLLTRALWQTAQRHPDLALLHHDESGLSFDALEMSYATRPQEVEGYGTRPLEEIEAAFNDLFSELLLLLARLLGRETAQRLAEGIVMVTA